MLSHLRPAVSMLAIMTVLTGLAYPLAMIGAAQIISPATANGSIVEADGQAIGSSLIGQAWTSDKYFHGRPSAAGNGYDALASSGSNLGATSQKLKDRMSADIAALRPLFGTANIPADAITASGSGLDPHISPAFALAQVSRVATARGLPEGNVKSLVEAAVERPAAGLLGEPRVNVLLLNIALDRINSPGNG
ncbi:potassium-transporting ATPase subunit KdpC [Aestuariivirga sp.]|uniref:potassium-transporting ATPase subunit KdpC n=1 Tax=Aestuariivirga sp. TaxID=2650926 RepID=UPI0039E5A647